MVRPRIKRIIEKFPNITYYKPAGVPLSVLEEVVITFDELEAIRLTSLKNMSQVDAADKMGVSQPTIHRLILSFEKKITDALINGKAIRIEGGDIMPNRDGTGTGPAGARGYGRGKGRGQAQGQGYGRGRGQGIGRPVNCRCPNCGTTVPHTPGVPCYTRRCPKCGTPMVPE